MEPNPGILNVLCRQTSGQMVSDWETASRLKTPTPRFTPSVLTKSTHLQAAPTRPTQMETDPDTNELS
jgi:hypothetical protein